MSYFEDWIEPSLHLEYRQQQDWYEYVRESAKVWTNEELILAVSGILRRFPMEKRMMEEYNKYRSIIAYGIGYQKLSEKQRLSLMQFILQNT